MATSAKEVKRKAKKRKRTPTVLEQLIAGCEAERVAVHFLSGDVKEGALLFNAIKQSGKLINIDAEFSLDFDPKDVRQITVLKARDPQTEVVTRPVDA